ncbi:apolipoprotein C-I-like [Synchiropus splendidus]|uniref:apolipoprotein C-I-like n=1 Tax=Synchiropus splendidus TaxID=270530 RepID=UPI00237DFDA0|nr:apolipoprotein C-I-like [Synchiropus splendidus]
MKLYLAVAVLLLAFVAYTDAQGVEERFDEIRQQFAEMGQTFVEKAKSGFQQVQDSQIPEKVRNFFQEYYEKMVAKVQGQ